MTDHGSLSVTWTSFMLPGVTVPVVVDGDVVARVGYRKPAAVDIPAGRHEVAVGTRYRTRPLSVDMPARGGVNVFGGSRRPPSGLGYGDLRAWAKENSLWVNIEPTAPPFAPTPSPAEPVDPTTSDRPGLWAGRRRLIPILALFVVVWSAAALKTPHNWSRIIVDIALIGATVNRCYVYWTDPLPPGYTERMRNQPRFGTKLWHLFAIVFLAGTALLIVAVLLWPTS